MGGAMRGVRSIGPSSSIVLTLCCSLFLTAAARADVWTPVSRTLHAEAHASATGAPTVNDTPPDKTFGAITGAQSHAASATTIGFQSFTGNISFGSSLVDNSFSVSGNGHADAFQGPGQSVSAYGTGTDLLVFDLNQPATLYLQFPLGTGGTHYFSETMSLLDSTGATTLSLIDSDGTIASTSLPLGVG